MPDAGEEVLAFPDTQARRLVGVSMRRLRYWEQVGLIVPSIKEMASPCSLSEASFPMSARADHYARSLSSLSGRDEPCGGSTEGAAGAVACTGPAAPAG